jgi:hypothetical protein
LTVDGANEIRARLETVFNEPGDSGRQSVLLLIATSFFTRQVCVSRPIIRSTKFYRTMNFSWAVPQMREPSDRPAAVHVSSDMIALSVHPWLAFWPRAGVLRSIVRSFPILIHNHGHYRQRSDPT